MAQKVLADYIAQAGRFLTAPAQSNRAPWLEEKASEALKIAYSFIAGVEQFPTRDYAKLMPYAKTNPVVRRALKMCGEAVASCEPILKIDNQEVPQDTPHPGLKLIWQCLKKPNPEQDGGQFISRLASIYKASGNGWVEHVSAMKGFHEFYALRHDRMTIVPGREGWPVKYIYTASGRKKIWDVQFERGKLDILHVKDFSLDDDLFGHGSLEAADKALAVYESAWVLAKSMFDNAAMPAGMLVYSPKPAAGTAYPTLTPEQQKELETKLDQKFKGPKNRGRPMVASQDLRWEPMGGSLVDMEAIALRESAARDIANAFGMPPMLLNIPGDATYSNFTEASRAFYRNTVFADARVLYGSLGRWWATLTGIQGLEITFNEDKTWALADELAATWARIDNADGLSLNEKREAKGYTKTEDPDGDVPLLRGGMSTLADVMNPQALGYYGGPTIDAESEDVTDKDKKKKLPAP